jgi:hypothetical protein
MPPKGAPKAVVDKKLKGRANENQGQQAGASSSEAAPGTSGHGQSLQHALEGQPGYPVNPGQSFQLPNWIAPHYPHLDPQHSFAQAVGRALSNPNYTPGADKEAENHFRYLFTLFEYPRQNMVALKESPNAPVRYTTLLTNRFLQWLCWYHVIIIRNEPGFDGYCEKFGFVIITKDERQKIQKSTKWGQAFRLYEGWGSMGDVAYFANPVDSETCQLCESLGRLDQEKGDRTKHPFVAKAVDAQGRTIINAESKPVLIETTLTRYDFHDLLHNNAVKKIKMPWDSKADVHARWVCWGCSIPLEDLLAQINFPHHNQEIEDFWIYTNLLKKTEKGVPLPYNRYEVVIYGDSSRLCWVNSFAENFDVETGSPSYFCSNKYFLRGTDVQKDPKLVKCGYRYGNIPPGFPRTGAGSSNAGALGNMSNLESSLAESSATPLITSGPPQFQDRSGERSGQKHRLSGTPEASDPGHTSKPPPPKITQSGRDYDPITGTIRPR